MEAYRASQRSIEESIRTKWAFSLSITAVEALAKFFDASFRFLLRNLIQTMPQCAYGVAKFAKSGLNDCIGKRIRITKRSNFKRIHLRNYAVASPLTIGKNKHQEGLELFRASPGIFRQSFR